MDLKPFARKVLASCTVPIFSTDEVAEMARAKPVTIRSWITRGYLTLQFATRPGKGRSMEFAPLDAIEVMTFSQMSVLGISPSKFSGRVASYFMSRILTQLHLIAETENFEEESKESFYGMQKIMGGKIFFEWNGFHRYAALTHPLFDVEQMDEPPVPLIELDEIPELNHPDCSIYVVIDCKDFAEKAVKWFMNYEARF